LVLIAIQSLVMEDLFAEELEALRARSLDRHLREISNAQGPEIEIAGRRSINFSSNDYLGLANDPRLREQAAAAVNDFGVGAGASRLISGNAIAAFGLGARAGEMERNRSRALFQQHLSTQSPRQAGEPS
jgi:7-keto-8-aminopelargonate synthetase-like enzyme